MISESIVEVTCKQSRCPTCRETYVPVVVTKTRVSRSSIIISKDIIEERERIKSGQMVRMKNGNVWLCICLLSCMSLLMFAATVLFFFFVSVLFGKNAKQMLMLSFYYYYDVYTTNKNNHDFIKTSTN